ncbi:DUF6036 family nucleotidyltransferase [Candidatus Jettenia sp. AMX1]|uniref:DUF6036 family nucleotidyltransferase n=1 Tax=Candidatus Jettenia sp. AMX1 TaxID=2293637 RepID=UPI000687BD54|nr:DUF6036 family nucleotidyltransferase [Candidatus Jettenia sp. AMX1]GJQ47267.1 MAG: hypothetical protein JETCAE04_30210 [Candidatus Jettenia caeni]
MHKDFEEFLKLLNYHKAKYVIVGGYALSAYFIPRATKDLDILIEPSQNNAIKVIEALKEFGFNLSNLETKELMSPEVIIQLGRPPVRIDILTSITGVEWKEVWKNRKKGAFGESQISTYFIGKNQLIKNKIATGREQDLLDVKKLKKLKE